MFDTNVYKKMMVKSFLVNEGYSPQKHWPTNFQKDHTVTKKNFTK